MQSYAGIARVSGGTGATGITRGTTNQMRSFAKAPRKAVTFFTHHHELLSRGLLCPEWYEDIIGENPGMRRLFKSLFGTVIYPRDPAEANFFL